jgi:hypothetical protein
MLLILRFIAIGSFRNADHAGELKHVFFLDFFSERTNLGARLRVKSKIGGRASGY